MVKIIKKLTWSSGFLRPDPSVVVLRRDSMVVMEGVCAASSSGSGAGVGGSDPITSHAAAHAHRSWYDQAAASLTQAGAEAGGGGSGSQSEIDAYFKAGSAANASSYFSQMQGAYSGMSSYHGESRALGVDIQDSEAIVAHGFSYQSH